MEGFESLPRTMRDRDLTALKKEAVRKSFD
jgi:hypothetical protein